MPPPWLWPHILSLEAPLVAVAWCWGLARLHDQPVMPGALPGLALCVWVTYMLDRTLDTFGMTEDQLDVRHRFYKRWRVPLLAVVIPICLGTLAWLALWVVPAGLMWQCLALGMLVMLYLAVYPQGQTRKVHALLIHATSLGALVLLNSMPLDARFKLIVSVLVIGLLSLILLRQVHERLIGLLPKEIAGGLIFALGCTAWTRFIDSGESLLPGAAELLLLTALFTCNLTGIHTHEPLKAGTSQEGIRHAARLTGAGMLAVAALLVLPQGGPVATRLLPLAWAVLAGILLLALLHHRRHAFSSDAYRVLADVAVLAPVLLLVL